MLRHVVVIVERANHLQTGQHPVDAVEFATRRLAVQVAPGHHRWQGRVTASTANKNIADLVNLHRTARVLCPTDKEITRLTILVGQSQTANTTSRRGPDLGHGHERFPEPLGVNGQGLHILALLF